MIRYIAVERPAAQEIISNRIFQSTEFEVGRALAELLLAPQLSVALGPRLRACLQGDGLFLVSNIESSKDYVVFELGTCGLFVRGEDPTLSLLYAQKVLRFAVKEWNGMRLSASERIIPNSTKAVIFPFPISMKTSFRISIELAPDAERLARRPAEGRCLLVYKAGTDEGEGPREVASNTVFRRFLDDRKTLPAQTLLHAGQQPSPIRSLHVTALDAQGKRMAFPAGGFDQWETILTAKQSGFVMGPLTTPHRIEGPAGTGKTLSLVLKAIATLRTAQSAEAEHRALFITHSEATRKSIEQLFAANDPNGYFSMNPITEPRWLKLTTLHQLCGEILGREISESELIDRDALESKQLQLMYVNEGLQQAVRDELPTHRRFMSPAFISFIEQTDEWALAEMFQHEISVVIKGRAEEEYDKYKRLPRLPYGLPIESESDRGFVWIVFGQYQEQLRIAAQFDTDDVVLTSIGQLDTPIWRRRRIAEGYDSIFIDETHLFNVNELSIFHYLTRTTKSFPIAYSVDRSQAIGDRDWSDELFERTFSLPEGSGEQTERTRIECVFRCSPEIVNLAFSVTSAGATLFTNFDDPLKVASSTFTMEEERKCAVPVLIECNSDEQMVETAFSRAEALAEEMGVKKGEVAIIAFENGIFSALSEFSARRNKPVELIKQRGDIEAVQRAEKSGRIVLSLPEYVGGLEFAGIILVGVDDGRVPPAKSSLSSDSANFLSYAAHNKLYVAITRAKYRVEILASKDRGISPLLASALASEAIVRSPC